MDEWGRSGGIGDMNGWVWIGAERGGVSDVNG